MTELSRAEVQAIVIELRLALVDFSLLLARAESTLNRMDPQQREVETLPSPPPSSGLEKP